MKELFSKRLKAFRKQAGLTQMQLAEKLDISVTQLSNCEKGSSIPSVGLFIKMCLILDKPAECFIRREKEIFFLSADRLEMLKQLDEQKLKKILDSLIVLEQQ